MNLATLLLPCPVMILLQKLPSSWLFKVGMISLKAKRLLAGPGALGAVQIEPFEKG